MSEQHVSTHNTSGAICLKLHCLEILAVPQKKKKQGAQNHHHGRPAPVALPSVFSAVTEAAHFKGAQIHKTAPQSHRLKEKGPCSLCTEDGSTEIPHLLLRGARSTRHRPHHPREVGPEMAAVSGRPQPAL